MSDVTFDRQGWSFDCDPSLTDSQVLELQSEQVLNVINIATTDFNPLMNRIELDVTELKYLEVIGN